MNGGFSESLKNSPLGKSVLSVDTYTPSLLHSIPRANTRERIGEAPSFRGEDIWNGYEFTWLDRTGKPAVSGIRLRIPCHSPCIVESKSLKLYLGSYAQTRFNGQTDVLKTLDSDLRIAVRAPLTVELIPLRQLDQLPAGLPGVCLDELEGEFNTSTPDRELLRMEGDHAVVNESVYSHLFRSVCPVTGQPDYATVWISYRGHPIARRSLLQYLVSYRQHAAFHEAVIETVWHDLMTICNPLSLAVHGFFQRRGGIDINPFRSSENEQALLIRLPRQ
jgi:7-cyano-7-deazaguanine reductase